MSDEQRGVLDRVKAGRSVFVTGSAGTGKSVLLREIIRWCRSVGRNIAVTASTGIAAVNVSGSSLHSWAAIRIGIGSAEYLAARIIATEDFLTEREWKKKIADKDYAEWRRTRHSRKRAGQETVYCDAYERWLRTETLIIDESELSVK